MKVKVAVLLGVQGVFEVDAKEVLPGVYDVVAALGGEIDIKTIAIAGSENSGLPQELKEKIVAAAEQALATLVGDNFKPLDKNSKTLPLVSTTVN